MVIDMKQPIMGRDRSISHTFGAADLLGPNFNANDVASNVSKISSHHP